MSFQDILKQPLPSQMGDNYIMEAANPAKIAADVMDLNKTYKASTKAIKEKIASVRVIMKSKEFRTALNIINNCRKDAINDRNEIGKRVKAIESAGLNKNTIRAITAGTAIAGGAKVAYDSSKSSKLKNAKNEARTKYNAALDAARNKESDIYYDKLDEIRKAVEDVDQRLEIMRAARKQHDIENKKINDEIARLQKDRKEGERLHQKQSAIMNKNSNINKKIEHRKLSEEDVKKLVDKHASEFNNASRNLTVHKGKVLTTNALMAAGGGISYATIKLFMLIKNNYEKYYDGVQKTLDELEDKCEKQSQNIKECLIDFIILNQDMEILLESAE